MAQLWVILKGGNQKKWLASIAVLTAVGMGALEVWRPGTLASIPSWIFGSAATLWGWMLEILNALRQLIRGITGWYD